MEKMDNVYTNSQKVKQHGTNIWQTVPKGNVI